MLWFIQLLCCSLYLIYNLSDCKELGTSTKLLSYEDITDRFLTCNEQIQLINQLYALNSSFVKRKTIGKTDEGRKIQAITFGYKSKSRKPAIWINAGIHAREWISHSSATFLMWNLANNQTWTEILKKIDIVVTPNSNPDGYEYTWKEERLWRKNRKSVSSESECIGVDLNRNFPLKWKYEVDMRNENDRWWKDNFSDFCSNGYAGSGPASEPEVSALVNEITRRKDRIKGLIDLHAFSQYILYPYSYNWNVPNDNKVDLALQLAHRSISMANYMKYAIGNNSGTIYGVGNFADTLYPAPGMFNDWALSIGIKYSYCIELEPKFDTKKTPKENLNKFIQPVSQIAKVGSDVLAAVRAMSERIIKENA